MNNGKKGTLSLWLGVSTVMVMFLFSIVWVQPSCVSQSSTKIIIASTGERNVICGYINDSITGKGIPGAYFGIAFFNGGGPLNTTLTNSTGYFTIKVYDGNYMCFGTSPSHNISIKVLSIGGGKTKFLTFSLIPCRARTATVKGYIKDGATTLPIANTDIVNMIGQSSGMPEYININKTNGTGYYAVQMPSGDGQLSLVLPLPGYYSNSTNYVAMGGQTIWVNLSMYPLPSEKGTIKGYVNESGTNTPIQYAIVSVSNSDQTYENSSYTNNSGYFEIDCIPGGLQLNVGAYGYNTAGMPFSCADGSVQWFNFTLDPVNELAVLKGYVKDGITGNPISNAFVSAMDPINYSYQKMAITESDGYYEMNTINGPMAVYVNIQGYYMNFSNVMMYDNLITWLNVTLDPAITNSTVQGYIIDGMTSMPIQGVNVQVSNQNTWSDSTTTKTDGYYMVKTIADHIYLNADMMGYYSNSTDFNIADGEIKWVNISLYRMLPENVTLKGYINDSASYLPIAGANVEVSGYGGIVNLTNTDPMGYYEMMVVQAKQNVFVYATSYGTNSSVIDPKGNISWLNMTLEADTLPPVLSKMAYTPKSNVSINNPVNVCGNLTEKYFKQDLVYFAKCTDDTGNIRNYSAFVVYSNVDSPDAYPIYTKKMDFKHKTGYEYGWNFTWNATGGGGRIGNSSGTDYFDSVYLFSSTEYYMMGQYCNASVPTPDFAFALFDRATGALTTIYAGMGGETTPQSDPSGLFSSSYLIWQVDVNSKNIVGANIESGTFYSVTDVTITLTSVVPSGDYVIIEQASDYGGNNNIKVDFLTVDNEPPVANAGAGKSVKQHGTVLLDAGASMDNVGITNYTWECYDGAAKKMWYGETISSQFSVIGNHTVWLNVTDGAKNTGHDTTWVIVTDGEKPVADAGTDQTAEVSQTVIFNGSGSTDNVGIVNYTWAFNDGGAKEVYEKTTQYVFKNLGTYTVTLTVTDGAGLNDTDSLVITVVDSTKPVADAGAGKIVKQNESFELDASASTDNVGITNYTWTFFDGKTKHTVYDKIVSAKMTVIGNHTVFLNITDGSGNTASDTTWILVTDGTPPVANAGADQTVKLGATVTFDGSGSTDNIGIVSYAWTFIDNGAKSLSGKTATYKFTAIGNYTVTLTVKDAAGNSATATMTVHVTAAEITPPVDQNAIDNNLLIAAVVVIVLIVLVLAFIAFRGKGKKREPEKSEDKPKEKKKEEEKPDEKLEKEPDKNAKTDDESKKKDSEEKLKEKPDKEPGKKEPDKNAKTSDETGEKVETPKKETK